MRSSFASIWTAVSFSYPVTALVFTSVPVLRYISLAFLTISSMYAIAHIPRNYYIAVVTTISCIAAHFIVSYVFLFSISSTDKFMNYIIVMLLFGLLTSLVFFVNEFVKCLDSAFTILGCFALSLFVAFPNMFDSTRLTILDANAIWTARTLGFLTIGAFSLLMRSSRYWFYLSSLILMSFVAIIFTGSRGPLLASSVACVFSAIIAGRFRNVSSTLLVFILLLGCVFILDQIEFFGEMRALGHTYATFQEESSATQRFQLFLYATQLVSSNPEGIGVGRFFFPPHTYPHNIFIEFLVEWGLAFGAGNIAIVIIGGFGVIRLDRNYNFLKVVYVFEVINACLSGDITSPRFLYGVALFGCYSVVYKLLYRRSALWTSKRV